MAGFHIVHAECLRRLESEGVARVVAGAEIDPVRAGAWGRKWNVPVYPSLQVMLEEAELDAVTVTTPSGLHGDCVEQIAAAGKHVLCEKPPGSAPGAG